MRSKRLSVILVGVAASSCVFISLENAQHSADLAEAAAASCSAAQSDATAARNAADRAQQAARDFQTHQDQSRALTEAAARARADAEEYRRRAAAAEIERRRLETLASGIDENAAQVAASCRLQVELYLPDDDESLLDSIADAVFSDSLRHSLGAESLDLPPCNCDSLESCRAAMEAAEADAAALETSRRTIPEAEAAARENSAAAERAEARARELEQQAAEAAKLAAADERAVETEEANAAELAASAQRTAFEQCAVAGAGPPPNLPPPAGTYQQDIFGAQAQGLPSACPSSCTAIRAVCQVNCGGTPFGCSPGTPGGPGPCLACFTQGCL